MKAQAKVAAAKSVNRLNIVGISGPPGALAHRLGQRLGNRDAALFRSGIKFAGSIRVSAHPADVPGTQESRIERLGQEK
jgi:hypothetical protein